MAGIVECLLYCVYYTVFGFEGIIVIKLQASVQ